MIYDDRAIDSPSQDRLGRDDVAEALFSLLASPALDTPLTVGILGGWGSGKTSLMRLLERRLKGDAEAGRHEALTLWFDSWAYARQEQSLWRALLLRVTRVLGATAADLQPDPHARHALESAIEELETSLYRSITHKTREGLKVNWGSAVPLALDVALKYATAGLSEVAHDAKTGAGPATRIMHALEGKDTDKIAKLIEQRSRESYVEEVRSLEQFRDTFARALDLVGVGDPRAGEDGAAQARRRLYVFVDDLDRCLPEDAVAAVEAIKLFLDLPGCVFILGMDAEVIQSGIRARYAPYFANGATPFRPGEYLDKIIQVPFQLPPLDRGQVQAFLQEFTKRDETGLIEDTRSLIEMVVPDNPRTLKRVMNLLRLAAELDGCGSSRDMADGPEPYARRRIIAKIVLMQICFPDAYRQVAESGVSALKDLWALSAGVVAAEPGEADTLAPPRLRQMLSEAPLPGEQELQTVLSLSRRFALPRA